MYTESAVGRGEDVAIRIVTFLVQTPLGSRPGLGTQPRYKAPGDLRVEYVKYSDLHRVSEAASLIMAQNWLWDSQIAVKKDKLKNIFLKCKETFRIMKAKI